MNKHIAKLTASIIILSSSIIPFSNAQAEEIKTPVKNIEPQILSSIPQSPFKDPNISTNSNGTLLIQDNGQKVIINDGGFNWRWLGSYDGDNVVWNQFDKHMSSALMAGLGGSIAGIIVNTFAKGVAGYISSQLIASIHKNANENVWFTVHKFYDYDAVNVYVKYRVWVYSDPSRSRSSIIKFYEEIHRT